MIYAKCVIKENGVRGYVEFEEIENNFFIKVIVNLSGLPPGAHGISICKSGECHDTDVHYNPTNKRHGGPKDVTRHIGDLGNITADRNGNVKTEFVDNKIKLSGKYSIIGRSVVIYEREDDMGKGGINEKGHIINMKKYMRSIKTGNSGRKIACGIIGYRKDSKEL